MWEWLREAINVLLWTAYSLALLGQFLGMIRDKFERGNRRQPG